MNNVSQQIIADQNIKNLAASLQSSDFELIFDVLDLIHHKLKNDSQNSQKNSYFRTRTAAEIFASGVSYGCTDYALATLALLRARGMKTTYVETFSKKWLTTGGKAIEGHVFVEVMINDSLYIVNPEQSCILKKYSSYVVFKRGLDSWDIGIHNFKDMAREANKFRKQYLSLSPESN